MKKDVRNISAQFDFYKNLLSLGKMIDKEYISRFGNISKNQDFFNYGKFDFRQHDILTMALSNNMSPEKVALLANNEYSSFKMLMLYELMDNDIDVLPIISNSNITDIQLAAVMVVGVNGMDIKPFCHECLDAERIIARASGQYWKIDSPGKDFAGTDTEWIELLSTKDAKVDELYQKNREISNTVNSYSIYQIRDDSENRKYQFEKFENVADSIELSLEGYYLVFADEWNNAELDSLFTKHNTVVCDRYFGHSLSVSDIIVTCDNSGKKKAYYVDSYGFVDVPAFLTNLNLKNNYIDKENNLSDICAWLAASSDTSHLVRFSDESSCFVPSAETKEEVINAFDSLNEREYCAYEIESEKFNGYIIVELGTEGWNYTICDVALNEIDGGVVDDLKLSSIEVLSALCQELKVNNTDLVEVNYESFVEDFEKNEEIFLKHNKFLNSIGIDGNGFIYDIKNHFEVYAPDEVVVLNCCVYDIKEKVNVFVSYLTKDGSEYPEDYIFNLVNKEPLCINGSVFDINPLRGDKSGSIVENLKAYEDYKKNKELDSQIQKKAAKKMNWR